MRRIEESFMFPTEAEANAYVEQFRARYCGPYEGRATVCPKPTLPAPFTHVADVSRWNSCD